MRVAPLHIQEQLSLGATQLAQTDPVMEGLIREVGPITWHLHEDPFSCLVIQIINQVISSKAADTVEARLREFTDYRLQPDILLSLSQEDYKSVGIGRQKYAYITGLAEAFLNDPDHFLHLDQFDDETVIRLLTGLKGIGKWTAQMFLMFALGRMDVFAPDDLVLFNATRKFYFQGQETAKKEILRQAENWAPWRSVASLYLWKGYHLMEG